MCSTKKDWYAVELERFAALADKKKTQARYKRFTETSREKLVIIRFTKFIKKLGLLDVFKLCHKMKRDTFTIAGLKNKFYNCFHSYFTSLTEVRSHKYYFTTTISL